MNYEEFKETICKQIKKQLPSDTKVQLQQIYKNNGVKLDGLIISNSGSNISPTIFLNNYYEMREHFPDLDAICQDILLTYEQNRSPENINVDFFTDYEQIKEHLAYRLVNYQKNKELLQTVPHVRYLDLAVVFYCLLQISDKGNATILIHTRHLKLWHITAAQLHDQTVLNTPKLLPDNFCSMSAVLSQLFDTGSPTDLDVDLSAFCPMYVLTNSQKLYGASCILYPGLLEQISKKLNSDLFILPSSIHEMIILPAADRTQSEELADMVADINQTELSADEILSSHIYYYSKTEQELSMCN